VRNLPDAFLSDPNTPPSLVSSSIGLNDDACEIYEIQVETIGFFDKSVNDFNNARDCRLHAPLPDDSRNDLTKTQRKRPYRF